MAAATLQPAAGAAGELTGLLLMRAWHEAQGVDRHKVIIPDSAHGTNPASVTLGGYEVVTVPSDDRGCVDMAALRAVLDEDVAGIMLTNPNTLGLFEEDIAEIAAAVHEVGGLLYYDGANLNAILGVVRPGDMGFDIVHMNLHKTFATPHGGGGPGAGPGRRVRAPGARSCPGPGRCGWSRTTRRPVYGWATPPRSHRAGPHLARQLAGAGPGAGLHPGQRRRRAAPDRRDGGAQRQLDPPAPHRHLRRALRPALHARGRCCRSASLKQAHGVRALDVAKRLLEEGFHSPTVYFPLIVDEALMIEPTETESPQTLEALAESPRADRRRGRRPARRMRWPSPPLGTPVRRVDEARAARTSSPPSTPGPDRRRRTVDGIFTTRFVDPTCGSTSASTSGPTAGSASTATGSRPCCSPPPAGRPVCRAPTASPTAATGATSSWWPPTGGVTGRRPGCSTSQADPRVTVRVGRRVTAATARVADPEEQAQLWPLVNRTNRGMSRIFHPGVTGRYDVYQRHTSAQIPVVIITPDRPAPVGASVQPGGASVPVGGAGGASVEQVGLLADDPVEERLEAEPTGEM